MGNNIELKSIKELLEMKFYIPNYQRGYRWTQQQVVDLLNDIDDFIQKQKNDKIEKDSFYCIQPLVVKEQIVNKDNFLDSLPKSSNDSLLEETRKAIAENTKWEVIDGQQRLTTIYILLSYLEQPDKYSLEYATRENSQTFLGNITKCGCEWNKENKIDYSFCSNCENKSNECKCKGYDKVEIDYYHIIVAYATIKQWLSNKEKAGYDIATFKDTLLNKVKFIWYESVDENPISVFTRLNIGKISLTNSELIKALILNRSNFKEDNYSHIRLKQQEIASEWDRIEYTLQNDEFWLFIHNLNYDKPTRIEFIFDLIANNNSFGLNDGFQNKIGADQYRTFRYFYEFFNFSAEQGDKSKIDRCWTTVKNIFQIFEEWYNDLELYHYVGYIVACYDKKDTFDVIKDLIGKWNGTKKCFIDILKKEKIKEKITSCLDLNEQYEISRKPKTQCKPLLLLHNVQTIIDQNKNFETNVDYQLGVYYKFPFHLYKIEGWDVEHIDSNTTNDIDNDEEAQKEYALNIYNGVEEQVVVRNFINGENNITWNEIKSLRSKDNNDALSDDEKNKIWNFTLLDSSTNRSYGNSIFSAKRRIIIGKDKGKLIPIPKIVMKNGKSILEIGEEKNAKSSFIPICTKHVFMKYYSSASANPNFWYKSDAVAYKANILETLKEFGVTDSAAQKGDDNNE